MRQILTAISFLAVLLAPSLLAAYASGSGEKRKLGKSSRRPRPPKGPITLFGDSLK